MGRKRENERVIEERLLSSEKNWHSLGIEQVLRELGASARGLTAEEVSSRLTKYGPNQLQEEMKRRKLALLIGQLKSPLLVVLLSAAFISSFADKLIDTIAIIAVIIVNTVIGFAQEFKAEAALAALKTLSSPEAEVIRECSDVGACIEMRVRSSDIVPGDIIILSSGDKVPADSRILECMDLELDESMLTGESTPVRKSIDPLKEGIPVAERKNIIFSGTFVTRGRAKAVVFATGMDTEIGKIAGTIRETEKAETPLKRRISHLSTRLGLLAFAGSAIIFVIGLLRGFPFVDMFLFSLAAAVSATPSGLPIALTVSLAIGVNVMAKKNAIIRKLQAVDALGSTTVICTDKTGTLTTNQMTVRKVYADGKLVDVSGVGYNPEGIFESGSTQIDPNKDKQLLLLLKAGALCNDSRLRRRETETDTKWEISGDPTEGALQVLAAKAGLRREELELELPRIDEIPFDSKEKYMVTFHRAPADRTLVFVKGAPEVIMEICSRVQDGGEVKNLTDEIKNEILAVNQQMAGQALRVLGVAYESVKPNEQQEFKARIQKKEPTLVFIGLTGMIDPPRLEVKDAIRLCKRAGIRVIMATGDQKLTAETVAREIGVLETDMKVLTGSDVDGITDPELDAVIDAVAVFSRVSPTHKFRIVQSLRRKGQIVAVTGDGVNDAPAMKGAEIGVAMGITGTGVTKETADMILTDDNFATIVGAVQEGRVVFRNIRKTVKYLVSTSVGELLTLMLSLLLLPGEALTFTPLQILWVNLVTDGTLTITLAMEPAEEDVMDEPPIRPNEGMIGGATSARILYVASLMAIGTLLVFSREWNAGNLVRAQTVGFTTMALFQVFNAINCRSDTRSVFRLGFFKNRFMAGMLVISVLLQVIATVLPPFQIALGTVALSVTDWLTISLVSSSVFIADELRKLVSARMTASH